jgi:hypothetical protein
MDSSVYGRREVKSSIVLRSLADPGSDGVTVADRQLLLAKRHVSFGRTTPIQEPHQVAAFRVAGDNHLTHFRALHDTFVSAEIEPALFIALSPRLVAAKTAANEDRHHVIGKTGLRRGRAHFIQRAYDLRADHPSNRQKERAAQN